MSGTAATAQDIIPPKSYTVTPGGINLADQTLVYSVTDLSVGTLTLERTHRTGVEQPNDPMFGWNFASNFDIFLTKMRISGAAGSKLVFHLGNSASGTYEQSDLSDTVSPNNMDAEKGVVTWNGAQYVYTDQSGTIYTFSATVQAAGGKWQANSRKIEKIVFPNGMVRSFSYDPNGYLKLVADSTGYAIVFDYNGNGDVTAACGFNRAVTYVSASSTCAGATLKTSYGYAYSGLHYLLTSAVDVLDKTTSYTNTGYGVTCIKPPGYATCKLSISGSSYGHNGSPAPSFTNVTETMADDGTWVIAGEDDAAVRKNLDDSAAPYNGHNQITVTDPNGKTTRALFTKTSPWEVIDPNGYGTAFVFQGGHMYDDLWNPVTADGSMLVEATYPDGDKYKAEYHGPLR